MFVVILIVFYYSRICITPASCKEISITTFNATSEIIVAQCKLNGDYSTSNFLQKNATFYPRLFFNYTKDTLQAVPIKYSNSIVGLWKKYPLLLTYNVSGLSKQCQIKSNAFLNGVSNGKMWALKMLDATAKLPSGILSGNVNQYGDYDECLSVKGAQYCLAEIDFQPIYTKELFSPYKNLVHSYFPFRGTFSDPQHRVPDFSLIRWGVCLPSECLPIDVKVSLEQKLGVSVRVNPLMCRKAHSRSPPWTLGDYIARLFFALVLLAVSVSTLIVQYHRTILNSEKISTQLLTAFSLQHNWRHLTSPLNSQSRNGAMETESNNNKPADIKAIDGIRALSALALIMCHKSVALLYSPYINRTETMKNFALPYTVVARTAIVYTDSFMLISGMLNAHSLLQDLDNHGSIKLKDKIISRIFRITPNIIALILFCTYILPTIGSGPLWPMVVQTHSDLCKKYMWRNIFYIHNQYELENMCLTHTHQVGIDMQLFLFTPILITAWWKNKTFGVITAVMLALFSTILRFFVTIQNNLSHAIYFGISIRQMFDTANLSYILPTHRATIYIMGILLTFVLRHWHFKPNINAFCWILFLSMGVIAMFGPFHMGSLVYTYNNIEAAIFASFSPILWGLSLCWVIYASNRGYAGFFGNFLSWKGFQLFTKIGYAFYLVQFPVFFYNIGVQKQPDEYSHHAMLHYSETSAIVTLSVILTLCVEMPFQRMHHYLYKTGT